MADYALGPAQVEQILYRVQLITRREVQLSGSCEEHDGLFGVIGLGRGHPLVRHAARQPRIVAALGACVADLLEHLGRTLMLALIVEQRGEVVHGVQGFLDQLGFLGDLERPGVVDAGGVGVAEVLADEAEHVQVVGLAALVADALVDLQGGEQRVLRLAEPGLG